MEQEIQNMTCFKHRNQKIVSIDLKRSIEDSLRFLCAKCLNEKIDSQNFAAIDETEEMIKDIKSQQQKFIIRKYEKKKELFSSAQEKIYNLTKFIEKLFQSILESLQYRNQKISEQLEEIHSNQIQLCYLKDVCVLSENYKGSYDYDIPIVKDDKDTDIEFIELIKKQFQNIVEDKNFIEILKILEEVKQLEFPLPKKSWIKQLETNKTPYLNINCKKHGKEIIMLNVKKDDFANRLACIDCIQQNPIQYITLEQANLMWSEIKGQFLEIQQKLDQNKAEKKKSFIKSLEIIRDQYFKDFTKLIQTFHQESQLIENNIQQSIKYQERFIQNFDEKHLLDVLEFLSQQNNLQKYTSQLADQELEEQEYFQKIIKNFQKLILIHRNNINNLLSGNNSKVNGVLKKDKIISEQKQEKLSLKEIQDIITKLDLFQIDNQVLDSILESYPTLEIQAKQLYQQNFDQQKEQPDNQFNKILQLFSQQYQNFINNTSNLRSLISIQKQELEKQQIEEKFKLLEIELRDKKNSFEKLQEEFKQQNNQLSIKIQEHEILQQKMNQSEQKIIDLEQSRNTLNIQIQQNEFAHRNSLTEMDFQLHVFRDDPFYIQCKQREQQQNQLMQYIDSLKFSQTFKHNHLSLSQDNKQIINQDNGGWYFGLCHQMIPRQGVTKVCFKVDGNKNDSFFLGVGQKEIMQRYNFLNCHQEQRGTYVILNYEGQYCNHFGIKKQLFKFQTGDIIMIEIDMENKFIRWTKKNTKEGFAVDIDTSIELYFCIGLWYRNQSVKILNQIF